MDERAKRYYRDRFKNWKKRVRQYLPAVSIAFYTARLNGKNMPSDLEQTLGFVIESISNPYYAIAKNGLPLHPDTALVDEVILEHKVNILFSFAAKLSAISTLKN